MPLDHIPINRGAVGPIECLTDGWRLIKDQYWFFVGISVVGMIIGSLAPLGILLGPCMCGIYYCLMRQEQGKRVEFSMLFKGFDYFIESLIATLLMIIPMFAVIVPVYLVFLVFFLRTMPNQPNVRPDPTAVWGLLGMVGTLFIVVIAISLIVQIVFMFIYPLIVHHGLGGVDAVKLSARAGFANLWGIVGLVLLNALFGLAGVLCCYIGAFFILPIQFASIWVAYRRVFGEEEVVYELPPVVD
jgi:uncharacterized membrane protein